MKITKLIALFSLCFIGLNAQKTIVEIKGNQFYINGKPTYEGRIWNGNKIEGLLMNSRMVQGVFDDMNPATRDTFAYPDTQKWDAERNNNEFLAAMPLWKSYGLNAFTLNMQGGSPFGYGNFGFNNAGFNPDGSLIEGYMKRLDKILKKADELEMVVILGFFYFGQDQRLTDETAIKNAVTNMINWLHDKKYRHILIEINNETLGDFKHYDHAILLKDRVHELINLAKNMEKNGYRYLVSTSFPAVVEPTKNVVDAADFVLFHANALRTADAFMKHIEKVKTVVGNRIMPIVINEDDNHGFEKDTNHFNIALKNYISWGYFDYRKRGIENDPKEGFQTIPVDWGINSERKKAFFNKIREVTGTITPIFGQSDWAKDFKTPPNAYKPMPFWHINGEMTHDGITQQMKDAKYKANFSGVTVLPVSSMKPKFLSEAFFEKYDHILKTAKAENMNVILYDDTGFPSGNAGGEMEITFPESLRKYVYKEEYNLTGTRNFKCPTPPKNLLAAVAMNTTTLERLDLRPFIKADILTWKVPKGDWKLMFFYTKLADYHKTDMHVDYLDTMAVKDFMSLTYDQYEKKFKPYFGNTILMTFYDDVGFWRGERSWTPKFNDKFQALYGYNPELFYPALWYNIGDSTARARIHFFNTRAELLAEGYPRLASEWAAKQGLKSTGHPPGNYDPQPVDMNGDIFKFYRHQHIPLADLIIGYGHGRNGFKLISSAADYYDKPITATEIYGALRDSIFDTKMLYRALLEIQARGINFLVPHGMWYDPKTVGIPPLVSSYNPKVADALFNYSDYAGRSCMMLQGGKKVSDIAILYPIHSLQANFHFDSPLNKRNGHWTYPEADYLKVGDMLTNEVRRDFTFVHPDFLTEAKYKVVGKTLVLDNKENQQSYHTVIISGSSIISLGALQKIKQFFDNGGNVIATSLLPTASVEAGKNEDVKALLKHILGDDLTGRTNANGGKSIFIKSPTNAALKNALTDPDIIFDELPTQGFDKGCFSYLHKVKQGKDIYFFANSTDQTLTTNVTVRGNKKLSYWNPHTGNITPLKKVPKVGTNSKNDVNSRYALSISSLTAVFWVSE